MQDGRKFCNEQENGKTMRMNRSRTDNIEWQEMRGTNLSLFFHLWMKNNKQWQNCNDAI